MTLIWSSAVFENKLYTLTSSQVKSLNTVLDYDLVNYTTVSTQNVGQMLTYIYNYVMHTLINRAWVKISFNYH